MTKAGIYGPAFALGLAGILAIIVWTTTLAIAQEPTKAVAHFSAAFANLVDASTSMKVDLVRWTSDMERDQLLAALNGKTLEKDLQGLLDKAPGAGYLWTDEKPGYLVRYARKIAQPDGSERVVLAVVPGLGAYSLKPWKVSGGNAAPAPFTIIELRIPKTGKGEGKMSLGGKGIIDDGARTLAVENYTGAPVLLKNVSR